MQYFLWIFVFLVGAALGSFIAVVANRYNTGLSFWKGRSFCFSCNAGIRARDLFPIFSFLFLKGKCRYCQNKIPKETLILEILMAVLTVLAALRSDFLDFSIIHNSYFIILTLIFGTILLISAYDLKHFIIPDSFLILFLIFSILYLFIPHNSYFIIQSLLSGIGLTLPFLLVFLISKGKWIGFGDVKYIFVIGIFLGFVSGLSAIILAFWIGAAFAALAMLLKNLLPIFHNNFTIKSEIPFGPFISLGVIISFWFSLDLFQLRSLFTL